MTNQIIGTISWKYGLVFYFFSLKAQGQIWDILQGASSLGVKFPRNILAWYDE